MKLMMVVVEAGSWGGVVGCVVRGFFGGCQEGGHGESDGECWGGAAAVVVARRGIGMVGSVGGAFLWGGRMLRWREGHCFAPGGVWK